MGASIDSGPKPLDTSSADIACSETCTASCSHAASNSHASSLSFADLTSLQMPVIIGNIPEGAEDLVWVTIFLTLLTYLECC